MPYYYFDSEVRGGPRIQEFFNWEMRGVGGGGGVWFRKACWTFLWQITSHRDDHVFLNLWTPVGIGAASTALRAKANKSWGGGGGRYTKTIAFLNPFDKKTVICDSVDEELQLQTSVMGGGGGGVVLTSQAINLDPPLVVGNI